MEKRNSLKGRGGGRRAGVEDRAIYYTNDMVGGGEMATGKT